MEAGLSRGAQRLATTAALAPAWRDLVLVLALGLASRAWVYGQAWLINGVFDVGRTAPNLLCSWDCGWYHDLVRDGYQRVPLGPADGAEDGKANWAFFPLFPLAARLGMAITGLGFQWSAQLLNNLAFLAALPLLLAYARLWLPREDALFVVALLAFSPFSLYFSVPYTEALYLLGMLAALLAARQDRWLLAGLCAAALSATRNLGVFLVLPLAWLAWQRFGWRSLLRLAPGTERCWLALVCCGAGLAAYMLFLQYWMGDAQAFRHVQAAWGIQPANPLSRIAEGLRFGSAYERYCAIAGALGLAGACWLAWRGLVPEALVLLVGILVPASVRLTSLPRYALTLFPLYLALGLALQGRPRGQVAALVASASFGGLLIGAWMGTKVLAV